MSRPWQDSYDQHAAGYARRLDPTLAAMVDRVVELAGAGAGVRLLDLATGTGAIARAAARRGASVVGIDSSAGMLEFARAASPSLELRLADACALPFASGAFDVVTAGLALSHFDEPGPTLAEVLRVLRPGGRFAASVWAPGSSFPTRAIGELLGRYVPADDELDEATWFDRDRGCGVLRQAGFNHVSVETAKFDGAFSEVEEALAWFCAWPLAAARLARLDPADRARFQADARKALARRNLDWPYAFNFYIGHRCSPRRRAV